MDTEVSLVDLLVQGGAIGVMITAVLFGRDYFGRSRDSSDRRVDSDKEVMLALIQSSSENTKQTAVLNKNTQELTAYLKNRNGSIEKHMDKQDDVHKEILEHIKK